MADPRAAERGALAMAALILALAVAVVLYSLSGGADGPPLQVVNPGPEAQDVRLPEPSPTP